MLPSAYMYIHNHVFELCTPTPRQVDAYYNYEGSRVALFYMLSHSTTLPLRVCREVTRVANRPILNRSKNIIESQF